MNICSCDKLVYVLRCLHFGLGDDIMARRDSQREGFMKNSTLVQFPKECTLLQYTLFKGILVLHKEIGVLPRFDKGRVYNPHTMMFPLHSENKNTMFPPFITNNSLYGVPPLYTYQRQIQVLSSCSLSVKMYPPCLLNGIVTELTWS